MCTNAARSLAEAEARASATQSQPCQSRGGALPEVARCGAPSSSCALDLRCAGSSCSELTEPGSGGSGSSMRANGTAARPERSAYARTRTW